jgi:translocation and assembly module TamB
VVASSREARLEHFCLRSGARSVCARADWSAGRALHAQAILDSLPVGLLDPFLPASARVIGTLDGSIDASADRPEGPLTARVRLTQSASQVVYSISRTERDTVQLGESRLTLDSDAHGARGAMAVQWASGDKVDIEVALPGFNALRPDTAHMRVEGRIRSHATNLAVLGAYVAGLDHTRGELNADLRLTGKFPRPDLEGEIVLKNGSAAVPALGVALKDITVAIRCAPGGRTTLEGSARSGTGDVAMTGTGDWDAAGWPVIAFGVKGKNFTCADTREATVKVSPDIQVKLQHARVDVSGQVDIPFARLVSINKAVQLPVPPSPDVVLVGREADSTAGGPKLYSRVRIVIGEDVEVRVPNFRGRPEGSILAIDEPGKPTRATGELKVEEGVYRAYGKDLTIERGRLIFGGGSISNPGLDLRASCTASDNTIAGVQITGTAESPELDLFSTPAMSQSDVLSYIMFGKPMNETGGKSGAAAMAGGQLSVQGTDVLARGVAGKFGIQDASVESKEGSLQNASLFIGTYLSPKLYMSYGIGLFESSTTIRMRYKMSAHWSVQTESGSQHSGLLQFTGER